MALPTPAGSRRQRARAGGAGAAGAAERGCAEGPGLSERRRPRPPRAAPRQHRPPPGLTPGTGTGIRPGPAAPCLPPSPGAWGCAPPRPGREGRGVPAAAERARSGRQVPRLSLSERALAVRTKPLRPSRPRHGSPLTQGPFCVCAQVLVRCLRLLRRRVENYERLQLAEINELLYGLCPAMNRWGLQIVPRSDHKLQQYFVELNKKTAHTWFRCSEQVDLCMAEVEWNCCSSDLK